MGVDSGLPDFRGPGGFWSVYPALGKAGIHFESIANPEAFRSNLKLAWGFYGHRLKLYRETSPGPAFKILSDIASPMPGGAFAFTSNVDGHFQRAGFAANRVWECHGSIHHLQCLEPTQQRLSEFMRIFTPKGAMELAFQRQQENRELYQVIGIGAIASPTAMPLLSDSAAQPLRIPPADSTPQAIADTVYAPSATPMTNDLSGDLPEFDTF